MTLPRQTRAFWCVAPGVGELRAETLPPLLPGQLLVQALYSGISRGTESLVFNALVPESEHGRMRAPFQVGDFPAPVKYGYAHVGRVLAGDAARLGQVVFSLHPHQEQCVLQASDAYPVPAAVPARRAVLAANMETALNALWDARPLPGDHITVIGAGVLGCLLAALLSRYPGIDLEVVDVQEQRASLVEGLGARYSVPAKARPQRDTIFHTSAQASGLQQALQLCRAEAQVIELSWYGAQLVPLPLGAQFHSQRLQLLCSQVGKVSPNKSGWSTAQRLNLALQLLDDARLDALLGPDVPFADLPRRMPDITGKFGTSQAYPGWCVAYA